MAPPLMGLPLNDNLIDKRIQGEKAKIKLFPIII